MLIEPQSLEPLQQLSCDVCIIGGGPAGITAALELAKNKHHVVLIESGHLNYSGPIQQLADANIVNETRHAPMANLWKDVIEEAARADRERVTAPPYLCAFFCCSVLPHRASVSVAGIITSDQVLSGRIR